MDDIEGTKDELAAEIAAVAHAVLSGTTLEETLAPGGVDRSRDHRRV